LYKAMELRRAALSLILPNRCPFCDRIVGMWDYWCDECYGKLQFVEENSAPPDGLDGLLSCCYYTGRARSAVLRMKNGLYSYPIESFAVLMTELVSDVIAEMDFVTAVPTTLARRRELGYAQAERIARNVAKRSGKHFRQVLKASPHKQEQKSLNHEERRQNALRSFMVCDKEYIFGKKILLVDDVTTTGATLSSIAGLLKKAGARSVYGLTFAKTRGRTSGELVENEEVADK